MKILYKYIIKNFIKSFAFVSLIFIPIGTVSDLLKYNEFYIEHKIHFTIILLHLTLNIPYWFIKILPIITLISLLFSLSDMSKKNEITAIKSAGINIWKIISLLLIIGLIIGIIGFEINDFIIPKTQKYIEKIQEKNVQKKTKFSNMIFFVQKNVKLVIGYLDVNKKLIKNIIIEKNNDKLNSKYLILSKNAIFKNGVWILKNGIIKKVDNNANNLYNETYFENYKSDICIKPTDMIAQTISYEHMSTSELKKHIDNLKISGQKIIEEKIAINMMYTVILSNIVVMTFGIPFAINQRIKLNKILSFTFAISLSFIYWCIQSIIISFGNNSILHPFTTAWLPVIIFTTIGILYISISVKK
ncbi:MAG: LptF/LptG family permease [Endomicrobium sp.]|jgi:lipopolysaccharide export system permease protein|nr:LptF/LptG family permease [Endomicrobium sp.]